MGLKVLLIDDSAVMRKMVTRSLRQSGLEIESTAEAGNGLEGIAALESGSFDLILCDWNMPEMDGLQFVEEARKNYTTTIVMLTTESSSEKIAQAMAAGANGFITKPFTPDKLSDKIDLIINP